MSKKRLWSGIGISGIVLLFLMFDAVIHILDVPAVVTAFMQLGYPSYVAVPLGIIELLCLVLYVIPRTSILGAILLTGYLGGAVASNVRVGAPLFSATLFPIYVAILLWLGLYLLDTRVSDLVPFKRKV